MKYPAVQKPITTRSTAIYIQPRSGVNASPTLATASTSSDATKTGLRPSRSAMVPHTTPPRIAPAPDASSTAPMIP